MWIRFNPFGAGWLVHMVTSVYTFERNPQTVFLSGCTNFVFPSTENDGSRCSTSSPAVGGVSVLDFRCPIGYAVVHYSSFHLQFPRNLRGSASLGMFICHLCVLDEVAVKIFCPFFNWIVFLLVRVLCIF